MPSRDVAAAARGMLAPMIASMFEARETLSFLQKSVRQFLPSFEVCGLPSDKRDPTASLALAAAARLGRRAARQSEPGRPELRRAHSSPRRTAQPAELVTGGDQLVWN